VTETLADLFAPRDPFADAEVISAYSRAQAIADGVLVDVTDTAREAGFTIPVAVTRAVWEDCCDWTTEDDARKPGGWTGQSTRGRLWDVLFVARMYAARSAGRDRIAYRIRRVKREGRGTAPHNVLLVMHIGPGDTADPVLTIMQPGED
jgi:hypothetical protein